MIHCLKKIPAFITYCGLPVEKLKPQFFPVHSDPDRFLQDRCKKRCKTCALVIRRRAASKTAAVADMERANNLARFLARGLAAQKAVDQVLKEGGPA